MYFFRLKDKPHLSSNSLDDSSDLTDAEDSFLDRCLTPLDLEFGVVPPALVLELGVVPPPLDLELGVVPPIPPSSSELVISSLRSSWCCTAASLSRTRGLHCSHSYTFGTRFGCTPMHRMCCQTLHLSQQMKSPIPGLKSLKFCMYYQYQDVKACLNYLS